MFSLSPVLDYAYLDIIMSESTCNYVYTLQVTYPPYVTYSQQHAPHNPSYKFRRQATQIPLSDS